MPFAATGTPRLELDLDVRRLVRAVLRRRASACRCRPAARPRILEHAAFDRAAPQVRVGAVRARRSSAGTGMLRARAYSISSAGDMPQIRAGAIT